MKLDAAYYRPWRLKFCRARVGATIRGDLMGVSIRNDQKVTLTIQPVDAFGNPAVVEGVPKWSVDGLGLSLAVSNNGLLALVTPAGPAGNYTVTAEFGALKSSFEVTVGAGQATGLAITAGDPQ